MSPVGDDEKPDLNSLIEHYGSPVKDRATYMTQCVLHDDRTPSMSVNTTKQLWKCQSCGEGGDTLSLIMKKENCTFVRARAIAATFGLPAGGTGGGDGDLSGSAYGGKRRVPPRKGDRPRNSNFIPSWRSRD